MRHFLDQLLRHRRKHRVVAVVLVLLAVLVFAACAPPPSSPASEDIVNRTNYVRGLNGLHALSVDGGLQANAQFHADRLAQGRTNCSGLWHSGEMAAWYAGSWAAENVACISGCPADGKQVFDMWLLSPSGHGANMMNPAYWWTGVATACNGHVQTIVAHYRS